MARKAKATVQMDKTGRVTIPKSTRLALGIDEEYADLNLEVELVEDTDDAE